MVKDTFVTLIAFEATVEVIENCPFANMMRMWIRDLLDVTIDGVTYQATDYMNRMLLPYPYQRNYISNLINWQSGYNSVKEKYNQWIKNIAEENTDICDDELADKLIHTKIPIFFDEAQTPTFEEFFKERIVPFLKSSISKEEYNTYQDHQVLIGLERNTHVILNTDRNPKLKIGRMEHETGDITITLKYPAQPQLYVKYDDGQCVFLGDYDYKMYSKDLIESQLKHSGTAYLYNNTNLE